MFAVKDGGQKSRTTHIILLGLLDTREKDLPVQGHGKARADFNAVTSCLVASLSKAFHAPEWHVGRYQVAFSMPIFPPSKIVTLPLENAPPLDTRYSRGPARSSSMPTRSDGMNSLG